MSGLPVLLIEIVVNFGASNFPLGSALLFLRGLKKLSCCSLLLIGSQGRELLAVCFQVVGQCSEPPWSGFGGSSVMQTLLP